MKQFEEMTKAEKMKVLEEDYLERKKQEEFELQRKEKRKEKWSKFGITFAIVLSILVLFASFVILVVGAVIEQDNCERTKDIVGAVFFGVIIIGILFGMVYSALFIKE